jgi:hypothetical protein
MFTRIKLAFTFIIILLSVIGCDDKSVNTIEENDPHKEIIINRQDFVYDYDDVYRKCLEKVGGYVSYEPNGINAISISKDKNLVFTYNYQGSIVRLENDTYNYENFDFSSIQRYLVFHKVQNMVFSPYDNNLAVILVSEEEKINGEFTYTPKWYYYRIDSKTLKPLQLDTIKHKDFYRNPKLIRWLTTSTPDNDKFFFGNNLILNYPSGLIETNPTGLQITEDEEVVSVSPDMQKFFTVKENELYLNGRKVPSTEYVYWKNVPISWSDDSKYFLGVGIEENKSAQLNIIYRMEPGTNSSFKIHRIIDITRNFCSRQSPSKFGFDQLSQVVFKSESSLAMTLFPNLAEEGYLCEIGFNGKLIRKLTE